MARFYITTPIYYINAEPHLGHAYTSMVADAIARSRRLLDEDVFFLTGTDEHGQKVERAAQKAGLDTREFADRIAAKFRELCDLLNISNDDFIRTTEPRHIRAAQAIWRRVQERGYLYKAAYEGWYCTVDELFVPETQLLEGRRCPTCGNPVERLSEESYFFRLSQFTEPLLEHYRKHPEFITPDNRRNEMTAFVAAGLKDLSVSRTSFKWGIPVPDDPAHVMYVWFDALTNYLTAAGFPDDQARLDRYWPADVHLMGKEIVRQHTRLLAGVPDGRGSARAEARHRPRLVADERSQDVEVARQRRPSAGLRRAVRRRRAALLRHAGDGARPGRELRGRSVPDAVQRRPGQRPGECGQPRHHDDSALLRRRGAGGVAGRRSAALDVELTRKAESTIAATLAAAAAFDFSQALRETWELISALNKYIVAREPWALAKEPESRPLLDATLYTAADALRVVASLDRAGDAVGVRANQEHARREGRVVDGTEGRHVAGRRAARINRTVVSKNGAERGGVEGNGRE